MIFDWDEHKRKVNIQKHGIDFLRAARVFDEYPLTRRSDRPGEERFVAVGEVVRSCDD